MEKTDKILVKSMEKLVKKNKKQAEVITDLTNRLENLEENCKNINLELSVIRANTKINDFHVQAKQDLKDYLTIEKDKDALEMPLTKKEISKKIKAYHKLKK